MEAFLYNNKNSVLIQLQKLKRQMALSQTEVDGISSGFKRTLSDVLRLRDLKELVDCSNFQDYLQMHMSSTMGVFWRNSRSLACFYYFNFIFLLIITLMLGLINFDQRPMQLDTNTSLDNIQMMKGIKEVEITTLSDEDMKFKF